MVGDALGNVVVDGEAGGGAHPATVLEFLSGLRVAACRPAALDAEQVVVVGCQRALSPARLLDGLGDGDGGGHAVLALRCDRPFRHSIDERLLCGAVVYTSRARRRLMALVWASGHARTRRLAVVRSGLKPRDGCGARSRIRHADRAGCARTRSTRCVPACSGLVRRGPARSRPARVRSTGAGRAFSRPPVGRVRARTSPVVRPAAGGPTARSVLPMLVVPGVVPRSPPILAIARRGQLGAWDVSEPGQVGLRLRRGRGTRGRDNGRAWDVRQSLRLGTRARLAGTGAPAVGRRPAWRGPLASSASGLRARTRRLPCPADPLDRRARRLPPPAAGCPLCRY